jgi:hypothetical protein
VRTSSLISTATTVIAIAIPISPMTAPIHQVATTGNRESLEGDDDRTRQVRDRMMNTPQVRSVTATSGDRQPMR